MRTARLPNRPTWGAGFAATGAGQAPHAWEMCRRARGVGDASRCVRAWASGQSALLSTCVLGCRVRARVTAPPGDSGFVCPSTSLSDWRRCRVLPSRPHICDGDSPGRLASQAHSSTSGPEGVRPGRGLQTHFGPQRDPGREGGCENASRGRGLGQWRGEGGEGTGASCGEPGKLQRPPPSYPFLAACEGSSASGTGRPFADRNWGGEGGGCVQSRLNSVPYPVHTNAHTRSHV